jgi:hypothetical protein
MCSISQLFGERATIGHVHHWRAMPGIWALVLVWNNGKLNIYRISTRKRKFCQSYLAKPSLWNVKETNQYSRNIPSKVHCPIVAHVSGCVTICESPPPAHSLAPTDEYYSLKKFILRYFSIVYSNLPVETAILADPLMDWPNIKSFIPCPHLLSYSPSNYQIAIFCLKFIWIWKKYKNFTIITCDI